LIPLLFFILFPQRANLLTYLYLNILPYNSYHWEKKKNL